MIYSNSNPYPHCFLQVQSTKHSIALPEWLLQPSVALIGPSLSTESDRKLIYDSITSHFLSVKNKSKGSKCRSSISQTLTQRDPTSYHPMYHRKNRTQFGWWSILHQLRCSSPWQINGSSIGSLICVQCMLKLTEHHSYCRRFLRLLNPLLRNLWTFFSFQLGAPSECLFGSSQTPMTSLLNTFTVTTSQLLMTPSLTMVHGKAQPASVFFTFWETTGTLRFWLRYTKPKYTHTKYTHSN